jgi:hypothetical protein
MSLIRAEDYLYEHPKHVPNMYWSELIKTMDEFDQLLEIGMLLFIKRKRKSSPFSKKRFKRKLTSSKTFINTSRA